MSMENTLNIPHVFEVQLSKLSINFASYRFVQPKSESAALELMLKFGQLTPIVVYQTKNNHYEIIDGFKRYRACKKLKFKTMKVVTLNLNIRSVKAAMLFLNQKAGTVTDLEEALLVQSLYKEDKLSQAEIAKLLNHHNSWVSRRISLIERLDEEVINHIKLDLISISIGRELMRLPRGNQTKVMMAVIEQNLTCLDTRQLIDNLLEYNEISDKDIKRISNEIRVNRLNKTNSKPKINRKRMIHITNRLNSLEINISFLIKDFTKNGFTKISSKEQVKMISYFDKIKKSFDMLDEIFQGR